MPDFATPQTVAHEAPLSMGFPTQGYQSGLPFSSPGNLPYPGIEPGSPAFQADSLLAEPPGKPQLWSISSAVACDSSRWGQGCHVFFPIPPSPRSGGEIPDKLPSRTLISHTLADDHWNFSHVAVTFSLCLSPLSMLSRNLKPGKKGLHLFSLFPIRRFSWEQGGLLHPVILLYGTQGLEGEGKCWKMIILWLILHWDWLV